MASRDVTLLTFFRSKLINKLALSVGERPTWQEKEKNDK